jgi:integrase
VSLKDHWWGRGDLNPGPPTPQAGILDQTGPRPHSTGLRPSIKGNIINTLFQLKNFGHPESTIKTTSDKLLYLAKYSDLNEPESVKTFIARLKGENSYKATLVKAYNYYIQMNGLTWLKPKYISEPKLPKIPTTEAIQKIIAKSSQKYATIFKLLSETGAMPTELHNVTLRDIDLDKGTIAIQGSKGHNSRIFKLKSETLAMLKTYLTKYNSNQPFPKSEAIGKRWRKFRDIVTNNLKEPQLKTIRLYDLRHYYATMLYHKTKDILYVKQQMGHKKIETTLIYTQLVNFGDEEWTSAVAKNLQEACQLIEQGFEYVTDYEDKKIFRKRK